MDGDRKEKKRAHSFEYIRVLWVFSAMMGKYTANEKKLEISKLWLVDAIPAYETPATMLWNGKVAAIFPM